MEKYFYLNRRESISVKKRFKEIFRSDLSQFPDYISVLTIFSIKTYWKSLGPICGLCSVEFASLNVGRLKHPN